MLTKKELKIFSVFQNNIFQEYTFQEIKSLLNEKSNNAIIRALKKFREENLIIKKNIGKNFVYKINFENDLVNLYWEICNNENIEKLIRKSLNIVKRELKDLDVFYSMIIFGSYSQGKFSKNSDLDIMIFIQDKRFEEKIQRRVENMNQKSLIVLDIHVITLRDYRKMLEVDYENLAKQILRNRFIGIYNSNLFYSFLKKELKNDFTI